MLSFLPDQLPNNVTLFWRVRAYNGSGNSPWSQVWTFTKTTPVITNDLVGYWKMEEGSGNVLVDHSGSGNNGTLQSTDNVAWVTGKDGLALQLPGSANRFALVPHNQSLTFGNELTIAAWVRPNALRWGTILSKASGNGFEFYLSANGLVELWLNRGTSGSSRILRSTYNYSADVGKWVHMAATFDGTTMRIYINGVQNASRVLAPFTFETTSGDVVIGALAATNQRFNGSIDEMRLYGRALSQSEIISLSATDSEAFRISDNQSQKGGFNDPKENASLLENASQTRDLQGFTRMYPNPVQDVINLELSSTEEEMVQISIFDMKGVQLLDLEFKSSDGLLTLDIANLRLKPGPHVLLVNTNGYQQVFKFLKK
jgi:hypothetical protein